MFSWLVQSDSTAQQLLFSFYEGRQTQSNTWEKTLQDKKTKDKSWRRARPEEVETQQMQRGAEVSGPEEVIRVQTFSCDSVLQTRLDGFFVMWLTWPLHCPICLPGEAVGLLFAVRFGSLLIIINHYNQYSASSQQISFATLGWSWAETYPSINTSSINTGDLWPSAATHGHIITFLHHVWQIKL